MVLLQKDLATKTAVTVAFVGSILAALALAQAPSYPLLGFIYWIVVGLIADRLAGRVMKGGGYGVLVDIILGIVGGIVGGWIFGMLGVWPGGGIIGSIIVAFVGAVILVWITRLLKKAKSLSRGRESTGCHWEGGCTSGICDAT